MVDGEDGFFPGFGQGLGVDGECRYGGREAGGHGATPFVVDSCKSCFYRGLCRSLWLAAVCLDLVQVSGLVRFPTK